MNLQNPLRVIPLLLPVAMCGCMSTYGQLASDTASFPELDNPRYQRIAVLPFQNQVEQTGVGDRISDKIANALTRSGRFQVYSRKELGAILAERDMADGGILSDEDAREVGRLASVHLLVTGACNRYDACTKGEERVRRRPVYGRDDRDRRCITGYDEKPYEWERREAFVECNIVVVDTSTGRQVASFYERERAQSSGNPPREIESSLLIRAEDQLIARVVRVLTSRPANADAFRSDPFNGQTLIAREPRDTAAGAEVELEAVRHLQSTRNAKE